MSNKGNILLVANWESNVGYAWWLMENFWVEISNHFEKQGSTSYLIYPKVTKIPATIASSGIKVTECNFHNHSIANLNTLHKLIKSHAIKYVYLSDSPSYSLFYLLLKMWGIKKIVIHEHTPGERTPATSWRKLTKSVIQHIPLYTADHFIAVTQYVYNRFIEVSCIPETKCSIAPNGIKPINLNEVDLKYAHHAFNIPKNRLIVVTTGRASYYKGIDFFIKCANELVNNQHLDQLHFIFCGDGPDISDFRMLVQQSGLDEHFTFAGKRSDIGEMLPSCDIGFHTSKGEVGYSLSILEYMSSGLATIVPNRNSTSCATQHLLTGLLYQPDNITSACDAINQCLNEQLRQSLSHHAIKEVEEKFNISLTNKALISILSNAFT